MSNRSRDLPANVIGASIVVVVMSMALLATAMLVNAFCIYWLWLWFIGPALVLPPLTLPLAAGLGLFVTYFIMPLQKETTGTEKFGYICNQLLVVFVGWVIHSLF